MAEQEDDILELTRVCFNNDKSMFCICHNKGFVICKTSPFTVLNNRIMGGEISIAQILGTSNIIFLASAGENPLFPLTHIMMFDDHKGKPIADLQIGHKIKNIKVNGQRLFVVGKNKIYIFKTEDLTNIGTFESFENEEGICAMAEKKENIIFAFPSKIEGYINIMQIKDQNINVKYFYIFDKRMSCIDFNKAADKLLGSSIDGTLIRVIDANSGDILDEFRRGNDKAMIFSLCCSNDDKFICSSSDKGTIHIFQLSEKEQKKNSELNKEDKKLGKGTANNTLSKKQTISKTRSFAFCKTNEECSYSMFSETDDIFLISLHEGGKFYEINFDKKQGGEAKIKEGFEIVTSKP